MYDEWQPAGTRMEAARPWRVSARQAGVGCLQRRAQTVLPTVQFVVLYLEGPPVCTQGKVSLPQRLLASFQEHCHLHKQTVQVIFLHLRNLKAVVKCDIVSKDKRANFRKVTAKHETANQALPHRTKD